MSLISIKAKNYKNHENIDFTLDGKSIVLIGDSGLGKSNLMNMVMAHLGIITYPDDAQMKGTAGGFTESKHIIGGVEYVIRREFENGKLKRFRMTADGRKVTWEDEIRNIFNGLSPATSYFDYAKFFFELRTPDKRFEYLIQCSIGQQFYTNKKLIEGNIEERGNIGSQRKIFESRLLTSDLNEDNYKSMMETYAKPHPTDQAEAARDEILNKRKSSVELIAEIAQLNEQNRLTAVAEEKKLEFEEQIISIDDQIKKLVEQRGEVLAKKERCNVRIAEFPINREKEQELQSKLDNIEKDNKDLEDQANAIYTDKMKDVELFNTARTKFLNDKTDLDKFIELDAEWHKLDGEIKTYKQSNIDLFKQKLPIEGLEIKEILSKPEDPNSKVRYEIWWKGREVSWETLSKGETLDFALKVQSALSPTDLKIIFIPEGQSMGSKLDDLLDVAKANGIQTVVEITERKHNFEIKFEEQFLQ
jgi:hypothetical protein